jgi:adenylate kinase family enzyme
MRRIVVLGTSGAGKSTLARAIGHSLALDVLELDAVHWRPDWTPAPREAFRQAVSAHVAQDRWIVDGNYLHARDLVMEQADTLIWLDYSMAVTFGRVFRRTFQRWWKGEELWNGNRERLWVQLVSNDSILLWVINTWRIRRRDYPPLLREYREQGKRVLRFRTPGQTETWLATLAGNACSPALEGR